MVWSVKSTSCRPPVWGDPQCFDLAGASVVFKDLRLRQCHSKGNLLNQIWYSFVPQILKSGPNIIWTQNNDFQHGGKHWLLDRVFCFCRNTKCREWIVTTVSPIGHQNISPLQLGDVQASPCQTAYPTAALSAPSILTLSTPRPCGRLRVAALLLVAQRTWSVMSRRQHNWCCHSTKIQHKSLANAWWQGHVGSPVGSELHLDVSHVRDHVLWARLVVTAIIGAEHKWLNVQLQTYFEGVDVDYVLNKLKV